VNLTQDDAPLKISEERPLRNDLCVSGRALNSTHSLTPSVKNVGPRKGGVTTAILKTVQLSRLNIPGYIGRGYVQLNADYCMLFSRKVTVTIRFSVWLVSNYVGLHAFIAYYSSLSLPLFVWKGHRPIRKFVFETSNSFLCSLVPQFFMFHGAFAHFS